MQQVKVWDGFVRLFHWGLLLLVSVAFLTAEDEHFISAHVRVGLVVLALVVARSAWGLWGSEHARFRAFVRSPRAVLAYAREYVRGQARAHLSHNPLGGAMVVALLVTLLGVIVTGAVVYAGPEWGGVLAGALPKRSAKAVKEIHEALSGGLVFMVGAHVVGVLLSSVLERQNLVKGMITGLKRAPDAAVGLMPRPPRAPRVVRLAAALAVGVAPAVGLSLLLRAPDAGAASPVAAGLLAGYGLDARKENPAFQGFSAEEGQSFYLGPHLQDGKPISCSTCHTADPRQTGRTPVGKVVDPIAPSANPERFTDRKKVEKWFKRNCNDVLGRACTAEEKGHFLSYLLTQ